MWDTYIHTSKFPPSYFTETESMQTKQTYIKYSISRVSFQLLNKHPAVMTLFHKTK